MALKSFVADLYLPDSILVKMFEDWLSPHIKDKVYAQRLRKFKDIIEATLVVEQNQTEVQKSRETHSQLWA